MNEQRERESPKGNCPLTKTQRKVLRIARDHPTINAKEIATNLGRSHNTVRVHFENILERLGLNERMPAVVRADESGWLDDDPP